MLKSTKTMLYAGLGVVLSACANNPPVTDIKVTVPAPLREPIIDPPTQDDPFGNGATAPAADAAQRATDAPALARVPTQAPGNIASVLPPLPATSHAFNIENMPLPAFINEVFGNILGLDFIIDASVRGRKDLVTVRIASPRPADQIYDVALRVLAAYGIAGEYRDDTLTFEYSKKTIGVEPPLLISGRTLPSVPATHRPIFQLVPLRVVTNADTAQWLRMAFKDHDLDIQADIARNSLMLKAPAPVMSEVLEAINLLDQPFMKGRNSTVLTPTFIGPEELAAALIDILTAQGIAASRNPKQGSVYLQPIPSAGLLLIFAMDPTVLNHARDWAQRLDVLGDAGEQQGIFVYPVRNSLATDLGAVANNLLGNIKNLDPADPAASEPPATPNPAAAPSGAAGRIVIDEARNILIFSGPADLWGRLLPMLKKLDTPAKQVLAEVTVAEVTLNDDETLGIEWALENAGIDGFQGALESAGLGLGGVGLSWFPVSNSGATRMILNAFASSQKISILSTPRIMVRSGETATIDVGTEVPVITSQGTTAELAADNAILQEIQYRKTGVILKISPTVYAGRNVDLVISQEVSEAQPNTISNVQSPLILNRRLETTLSLSDGGSVLLGGMISSTRQTGHSGVPGLKDLPFLGQLFRVNDTQNSRTELLIMIVPYILGSHEEAQGVSRAFQDRLSF